MKAINLLTLLILILSSSTLLSQQKIERDKHYFWDKNHNWDNHNNWDDGVVFYKNFYNNGQKMLCVSANYEEYTNPATFQKFNLSCLNLYEFNQKNNEFSFVKKIDQRSDYHESLCGTPVCFMYNSKNYILNYYFSENTGKHFQKLYYTENASVGIWHSHNPLYSSEVSVLKYYKAAFVSGDFLYLVYDSYYKYEDDSEEQHYYSNDIKIDVCKINSDNELVVTNTHTLNDVMEKDSYHPYELDGFIHPDGHIRLLISYSAELTQDDENKGGGVIVYKPVTENIKHLFSDDDYVFAIRATVGTIKGKRTFSNLESDEKNNPFQIQVFYNHFEDHSWGPDDIGHYYYRSYSINGENYDLLNHGLITHDDDDELPDEWNNMCLDVTYCLESLNQDDENPANDSYKQKIYLFRTDKHNYIHADVFYSDQWKPNPAKTQYSVDLNDTTKYGSGIKNLWTLVGITEGAPPASIDWEVWDNTHTSDIDPTELSFTSESSNSTSVSYCFDRTQYSKTGIKIGNEEDGLSSDLSYKYTNAYSKEESSEVINSISQTTNYSLNEESQEDAALLWLIPNIYRVEYSIFPWWDSNYQYPCENSESYLFYSPGGALVTEIVPISNMPFNIADPNNQEMTDWKISAPVRDTIQSNSAIYNIVPVSVSWSSPQIGGSARLFSEKTVTSTTKQTSSYEIEEGVSFTIPEVFKITETISIEDEFSTEIEHKTSISKEVEVSLKNLALTSLGPQISNLTINTYFFEPLDDENNEEIDWWYYKYFDGQKPWYITYIVTSSNPVVVKSPASNNVHKNLPEIIWENPNKGEYNYSILFSHDSRFHPSKTIEIKTGKSKCLNTELSFDEEFLSKDSLIYYVVKGVDEKGNTLWSEKRWLMISDQYETESINPEDQSNINFIIYPNPVCNGKINVLFRTLLEDRILKVEILSSENKILKTSELEYSKFNCSQSLVDVSNLKPGIYYIVISDGCVSGCQKVIIN